MSESSPSSFFFFLRPMSRWRLAWVASPQPALGETSSLAGCTRRACVCATWHYRTRALVRHCRGDVKKARSSVHATKSHEHRFSFFLILLERAHSEPAKWSPWECQCEWSPCHGPRGLRQPEHSSPQGRPRFHGTPRRERGGRRSAHRGRVDRVPQNFLCRCSCTWHARHGQEQGQGLLPGGMVHLSK